MAAAHARFAPRPIVEGASQIVNPATRALWEIATTVAIHDITVVDSADAGAGYTRAPTDGRSRYRRTLERSRGRGIELQAEECEREVRVRDVPLRQLTVGEHERARRRNRQLLLAQGDEADAVERTAPVAIDVQRERLRDHTRIGQLHDSPQIEDTSLTHWESHLVPQQ
jgi:hypothetical protein